MPGPLGGMQPAAVSHGAGRLAHRYQGGGVYVIDVSQSVEHDHPHALEFLRKDCANVNGEWRAGFSASLPRHGALNSL